MKIELGKRYINGRGEVHGPMLENEKLCREKFPFSDGTKTYMADGIHCDMDDCDLHLVSEYIEPESVLTPEAAEMQENQAEQLDDPNNAIDLRIKLGRYIRAMEALERAEQEADAALAALQSVGDCEIVANIEWRHLYFRKCGANFDLREIKSI